jgi:hypothetical protein
MPLCVYLPSWLASAQLDLVILIECKGNFKTVFYVILVAHAVVNFFTGGIDLIFVLIFFVYGYWPMGKAMCMFWLTFDNMLATVETLYVFYLGWVRIRCVLKPKTYTSEFSVKYCSVLIGAMWIISTILWMIPVMIEHLDGHQEYSCGLSLQPPILSASIVTVGWILPLLFVIGSTVFIVVIITNRKNRLIHQHAANQTAEKYASNSSLTVRPSENKAVAKTKANNRTQKKLTILIAFFPFQYLPFPIFWLINIICDGCIPSIIPTVTYLLTFLPSLTNPLLVIVLNFKLI